MELAAARPPPASPPPSRVPAPPPRPPQRPASAQPQRPRTARGGSTGSTAKVPAFMAKLNRPHQIEPPRRGPSAEVEALRRRMNENRRG